MTIAFQCPGCQATLKVPDTMAGRRGKCPKCGTVNVVPTTEGQIQPAMSPPRPVPTPAPEAADEEAEAGGGAAEAGPRRKAAKQGRSRMLLFAGLGCGAALLLLCLGVGAGVGVWWYMSSGLGDELTYMPGDSEILASVRLDQLLTSNAYKQVEKELPPQVKQMISSAKAQNEIGLQLSNVDRIVVGGAMDSKNQFVVAVRTKQPVKAEDMVNQIKGKKFTGTKVGSYTLYETASEGGEGFCVANKKLVLFGPNKSLRDVLQRNKKPTFSAGLSAAMKEADFSRTIVLAMAPKPAAARPRGPAGFPFPGAMPFGGGDDLEGAVLQVKVTADVSVSVVVLCKDSATATAAKKKLDEGMTQMKSNQMVPKDISNAINVKTSVSGRKVTATTDIKVAPLIQAVKSSGLDRMMK